MSDTPDTDALLDRVDGAMKLIQITRRERDEARAEIEGWRNKWQCAVDMAARAERERDEARAELAKANELLVVVRAQAGYAQMVAEEQERSAFLREQAAALREQGQDALLQERDEWRKCAELLAELAQHPREGDEFIGDYVELRARAMGAFRRLKEASK